jgi:putative phosphoserine phosphatase / 1-acylglycerol-3-phosphate O-acyltransferase
MSSPDVLSAAAEPSRASTPEFQCGIGAFFDMDNTVLRDSSGRLYLRYLRRKGLLSWPRWLAITGQVGLYVMGATSFPQLMARLMTQVAGADEAEAWRISAGWFDEMLRDYIAPAARARIAWHRQQRHHVAIVSASTPYAVSPVAHDLGLGDNYVATRLEVVSGRFTGGVIEPPCYGAGKVTLAHAYSAQHNLDMAASYFYTDSHHDLPLLESVGHPVVVNPDRKLKAIALERHWRQESFY